MLCFVLPLSFFPAEGWNHGTNLRVSSEATQAEVATQRGHLVACAQSGV